MYSGKKTKITTWYSFFLQSLYIQDGDTNYEYVKDVNTLH